MLGGIGECTKMANGFALKKHQRIVLNHLSSTIWSGTWSVQYQRNTEQYRDDK